MKMDSDLPPYEISMSDFLLMGHVLVESPFGERSAAESGMVMVAVAYSLLGEKGVEQSLQYLVEDGWPNPEKDVQLFRPERSMHDAN